MLNEFCISTYGKLIHLCCFLGLVPYKWDVEKRRLIKGTKLSWLIFNIHFLMNSGFTIFAIGRLIHANGKANFPLLLRILNTAWIGIYTLTCFSHYQVLTREAGVRGFVNQLLSYMEMDLKNRSMNRKFKLIQEDKESDLDTIGNHYIPLPDSKRREKILGCCLFLGMVLWALNPGIHATLVYESPCAPHFSSSLFLPCEGFRDHYIPWVDKVPFIALEYYLTTIIFTSFSWNWAIIFLGLSWVICDLKRMQLIVNESRPRRLPPIVMYRGTECILSQLNDSFRPYLSTFPILLYTVVSLLLFGVIRIWKNDPFSNLMFPLCGARCFYEAITPLEVAGNVNETNKKLVKDWRQRLQAGNGAKAKIRRLEAKTLNGVRCTAGSLYKLENSISLCCLNNMIAFTLNLLVTFKGQ